MIGASSRVLRRSVTQIGSSGAFMALTFLVAIGAVDARADGIDRSLYRDRPRAYIATIPVNGDDDLPKETREHFAGQRPYGEFMVYYRDDGTIDVIDAVKSIPDCDEFVRAWLKTKFIGKSPCPAGTEA